MLTLEHAVRATRAHVENVHAFPANLRVVTDTRTLQQGDTFLALRGERFDGHAYVREAIERGAAAIIIDDPSARVENVATLVVEDTRRAYMLLADAARDHYGGVVIAITGSAGKTTTKHLLEQILCFHYGNARVLATPANENNELGVSKLLLRSSNEFDALVIEMGARHPGEIAELAQIARPHVGVLTNIGEAHVEIFGSRESLAQTKWGIFSKGAQAVLNALDSESVARARELQTPPLWFGTGQPRLPGVWVRSERMLLLNYGQTDQEFAMDVPFPGVHNRSNLAAAISAALLLGIPASGIVASIPRLRLPPGRYQTITVENGPRIVYDAYNANASGTIATLEAFAAERGNRRIAILASMAELGSEAPALHERIGAHAASSSVDILLVGGDFAASIAAGALAAGFPRDRIVTFRDNAQAAQWVREHARPQDVVLLKGSRKYRMEEIVRELAGDAQFTH